MTHWHSEEEGDPWLGRQRELHERGPGRGCQVPCWGCPCTVPESILLTDPEVNGTPWRCAQSSPHWNWALKDESPQKRQGWTLLGENTVSTRTCGKGPVGRPGRGHEANGLEPRLGDKVHSSAGCQFRPGLHVALNYCSQPDDSAPSGTWAMSGDGFGGHTGGWGLQ